MSDTEKKERKLNAKQELFCKLFASDREFFGNGTQAYIEAYNIDIAKPGGYSTARANAHRLLTNADILSRINELLETGVLNDENVDKQLGLIMMQNADFNSKLGAIREYNQLKSRITKKIDHTSGGQPMNVAFLGIPQQSNKE